MDYDQQRKGQCLICIFKCIYLEELLLEYFAIVVEKLKILFKVRESHEFVLVKSNGNRSV